MQSVSKPFKKPRPAKATPSSVDSGSEEPTQLPSQHENVSSSDLELTGTKNKEYVPSPASLRTVSETEDEQDNPHMNIPSHIAFKHNNTAIGIIPGIRPMSEREADETARHGEPLRWSSSDSEGDEVPIAQIIGQKTKQSDISAPTAKTKAMLADIERNMTVDIPATQAIPEGQEAVGVGIARDFGKDVGVFKGEVTHVKDQRKRHIYHVQYEDGDSEDFDLEEYQFAYEVRQALDAGIFRRENTGGDTVDTISNDGTEDEWHATENVVDSDTETVAKGKRTRKTKKNKDDGKTPATTQRTKQPRAKKVQKLMNNKTYTTDSVLLEFGEDDAFGQEYRKLDEEAKKKAVEKLNLGATKGIKSVVKEKVLATKYSSLCLDKLKEHLIATRVAAENMFREAPLRPTSRTIAAASVFVGDWVQVDADRSTGWNSEGGIAMVIAVHDSYSDVKYSSTFFMPFLI